MNSIKSVLKRLVPFGALVLVTCCSGGVVKEVDFVGADAIIEREVLSFDHPAQEHRFDAVRACWQARAAEAGWNHLPLRQIGNFVQEDWCAGPGSERGCSGGRFRETGGARWLSLFTLHYPKKWPSVFGLGIGGGTLPDEGWGASFSMMSDGGSIVGEGLHFNFHAMEAGKRVETVSIGDGYSYELHDGRFVHRAEGTMDEVVERLTSGPEALRSESVAAIDALERQALAAIDGDALRKCIPGPYEGDGVPPECDYVPLDESDKAEARGKVKRELGQRRALIDANFETFNKLLRGLVPLKCLSPR